MRKFRSWIVVVFASVCAVVMMRATWSRAEDKTAGAAVAAATAPAAAAETTPKVEPSSELAARYAALGQDTLRQRIVVAPHFKEAAALIMAAARLDPNEPRYQRMLYEAMLQIHDVNGALKAIKAYRSIFVPSLSTQEQPVNDQLMMVNYIDLSASQLETAEARLDYYRKMIDTGAPDAVRSYAAFRASQIARERGDSDLEDKLIGEALKLNPLNLPALRIRYEQLALRGTPLERIDVLASMLKSNPVQPIVLYRLASETADAGMPEDSLRYYTISANLAGATGTSMGREFAMGYASELYMMGQAQLLVPCKEIIKQLLRQDSGDVEALLLRWLCERAGGAADKDNAAKTAQQVLNAALNRVLVLQQMLNGSGNGNAAAGPATRPVESAEPLALPDLSGDKQKLKDPKFEQLQQPYAQAVTDLAWYLVFVGNDPAKAEKLLPALKTLLPDNEQSLVRIEGWIFKAQGKTDQANVKLKAVADRDVLAQAATLVLWAKNPAEKAPAQEAARKLLSQHCSGLLGAVLLDTLHDLNIKVVARDDGEKIKALLAQFPANLFRIIDAPQTVYSLKAEMAGGKVTFLFGEPMICQVTIKNLSPFDLTIGPEGMIHNDLWFDVLMRGLVQKVVTGAAYDRLSQVLVLKPGESMTQSIRIDQGQLSEVLVGNPNPSLTFYGRIRTNPRGEGGTIPGGQETQFSSITERTGFGLNPNSVRNLTSVIAAGAPGERIRSLELMAAELEQLRNQPDTDENKLLITSFLEILQRATEDTNQNVATWATFLNAVHHPDKRAALMEKLRTDPDPVRRLLSLLIGNSLPPDQQKTMLTQLLASEKDEMVRLYASAMLDIAQVMIANPTTAPATRPANAPSPSGLIPPLEPARQP